MKKIILVVFILLSVLSFSENNVPAKEAESKYKISLGFMAGYGNNLYKLDDDEPTFIPLLILEGEKFYIRGTEIGYRHELNSKFTLTGFTQLLGGVSLQGTGTALGGTQLDNSDMKDGYDGIDDRDRQVEFGLRLAYKTGFQRVKLVGEVRGGERGASGKITALRPIDVTDKFSITPRINLTLIGKDKVDYYFGVDKNEASDPRNTKINKAYDPDESAYAAGIGVTGRYKFTPNWSAFGLAEIQYVSDEIGDSPIVDDTTHYFVGLGLRYDF